MPRKITTEAQIQEAVATYLDSLGLLWAHVPNESKRGGRQGKALQRAGMKRGVPDVLVFTRFVLDGSAYSGLALELKTATGRTTKEQREWLDGLRRQGWYACTAKGLLTAMEIIRRCYVCELCDGVAGEHGSDRGGPCDNAPQKPRDHWPTFTEQINRISTEG